MAEPEAQSAPEAEAAAAPPVVSTTPEMDALATTAPKLMAEQMGLFIQKKDLNVRAQVRLRMKALLDLFSVDTGYPPVPALNPDQRRPRGGRFGGAQAYAPGGDYVVGRPQDPAGDAFRDGIEIGLEAEVPAPGVQPAPGAEMAPPVAPVVAAQPVPAAARPPLPIAPPFVPPVGAEGSPAVPVGAPPAPLVTEPIERDQECGVHPAPAVEPVPAVPVIEEPPAPVPAPPV